MMSFEGGDSNSTELWLTTVKTLKKKSLCHNGQDFSVLKMGSSSTTWHKYIRGWKKIEHALLKSKLTWR